jgi:serine/threonine protein kinase
MAGMRRQLRLDRDDPLRRDFHLLECGAPVIGAGTDGFILRAVETVSGYSDALKFVRATANDVTREIQALQAVGRHDHVVELLKVYAPCGVRKEPVLVFPELHGTLADFIRRDRRNSVLRYPVVALLAQQCLQGLAHVHERRVVHRDLSPSNILVDIVPCANTGNMELSLKIADFSRARVLPASEQTGVEQQHWPEQHSMTTGLGTVQYSAPELLCCPWQGPHQYGVEVDVWAFGAIWFEVLSGTVFMPHASEAKMVAALTCRLGPCGTDVPLGPRKTTIWPAAQNLIIDMQKAVQPLSSFKIPGQAGWEVLEAALQWGPSLRPSAAALAKKPWAEETVVVDKTLALPLAQVVPEQSVQPPPCTHTGETWQFCAQPFLTKPEVTGQCGCSGHCYTPGHRYWGCDSKLLAEGSSYCQLCECVVAGCLKPKHHGPMCCAHKRILSALPLEARLMRAARAWLPWLIPCDATDFVRRFASLRHNVALLVVVALLKEPDAVSVFLQQLPDLDQVTAENVYEASVNMLSSLGSEGHTKQMQQLNRQGVARFLGSASTCRQWGVAKPAGTTSKQSKPPKKKLTGKQSTGKPTGKRKASAVAATHGDEQVRVGLCLREYLPTADCSLLVELVAFGRSHSLSNAFVHDVASFKKCVAAVRLLDEAMSKACSAWKSTVPYGHAFLRRKLVLALLCATPVSDRCINWAEVSTEDLRSVSPDQHEILDLFPNKWSAQEVSLFCFDRCDWAMFAALFGCLFAEVSQKIKAEPDRLVKLVESEAFGAAAKAHHEQYGIASHPFLLVQGFGRPESWPVA